MGTFRTEYTKLKSWSGSGTQSDGHRRAAVPLGFAELCFLTPCPSDIPLKVARGLQKVRWTFGPSSRAATSRRVAALRLLGASNYHCGLRTICHSYDLTKFKKSLGESADEKDFWLYSLIEAQEHDTVPENMADQTLFGMFYAGLRRANFSSEQETNYFNDMTTQRDINNQIKFAQDKGYAEGEAKGYAAGQAKGLAEGEQIGRRDERIKMAKSLKEQGVSAEVIANASGLSIEEIEKL